jgi:hypothetical protein
MTEYQQHNRHTMKELLACYHVHEGAPNEDDPRNIHITNIKGERSIFGIIIICCSYQSEESQHWHN